MERTFVIGDIHGANKALVQCLKRSNFNFTSDTLICLGDICDGWPEVFDAVETILTIRNLVYILGNHDYWALDWMKNGNSNDLWLRQGGEATISSYKKKPPQTHIVLFKKAKPYYVKNDILFVHGGFNENEPIEEQSLEELIWNRSLIHKAMKYNSERDKKSLTHYKEVYIGHTPTLNFGTTKPINTCELWLMDTGAGWTGGVLSIMNIKTKDIFQSDPCHELYPGSPGRNKF